MKMKESQFLLIKQQLKKLTSMDCFSKEKLEGKKKHLSKKERQLMIAELTKEMKEAAKLLEFEHAAYLRDQIAELEGKK